MPYVRPIHSDYDSVESIFESDFDDEELRKMLASPLYKRERRETDASSQKPTVSGKPEAVITQKRGASAQRTLADHSRRELDVKFDSRVTNVGKPDTMFSSRNDEPRKPVQGFYFEILFLKAIKII